MGQLSIIITVLPRSREDTTLSGLSVVIEVGKIVLVSFSIRCFKVPVSVTPQYQDYLTY